MLAPTVLGVRCRSDGQTSGAIWWALRTISLVGCHLHLLHLKPIALHAISVLVDHTLAVFLRIVGSAEQHAVVARYLLVLAYTAWLDFLGGLRFGWGLEVGSEIAWRRWAISCWRGVSICSSLEGHLVAIAHATES